MDIIWAEYLDLVEQLTKWGKAAMQDNPLALRGNGWVRGGRCRREVLRSGRARVAGVSDTQGRCGVGSGFKRGQN